MTIPDIRAFVAIAETGSVNRASRLLRLTQPATTRRLQNLEASLGATLLNRGAKPLTLTAQGRTALERCRAILRDVDSLRSDVGNDAEPAGELRIGVAHGVSDLVLSQPIDDLRKLCPLVRPVVQSGWTRHLVEAVRSGALDVAVALIPADSALPKAVAGRAVGTEEIRVVAATQASIRKRPRLDELATQPWVLNPEGCGYRAALQQAFNQQALPLRVAAEIIGKELQLSLVARGLGLGLVPRRFIAASAHRDGIRAIPLADFKLDVLIKVIKARDLGRLDAAARCLGDSIEAACAC